MVLSDKCSKYLGKKRNILRWGVTTYSFPEDYSFLVNARTHLKGFVGTDVNDPMVNDHHLLKYFFNILVFCLQYFIYLYLN